MQCQKKVFIILLIFSVKQIKRMNETEKVNE